MAQLGRNQILNDTSNQFILIKKLKNIIKSHNQIEKCKVTGAIYKTDLELLLTHFEPYVYLECSNIKEHQLEYIIFLLKNIEAWDKVVNLEFRNGFMCFKWYATALGYEKLKAIKINNHEMNDTVGHVVDLKQKKGKIEINAELENKETDNENK